MIGQTISHYKILEKLGSGGMGVVYKAQDTKLDRFVALKFLPPHLSQAEEEKKRFIHEAKAASALDHNNICTIYEIGETEDGQMFIAMACYEGETLKKKIERGPLKLEDAIDIAIQISQGLAKAHSKEITHRDIKPANILITEEDQVKIVDFGLAKLAGRTVLTKEGTTIGTVAYMSPEQAQGTEVDHRTDIWALGVVLYEMLTGKQPFVGDYEQAVMYSIINEDAEPITGLRTGVPMELEWIVNKAIAKTADERYQHVDEMQIDLKNLSKQFETSGRVEPSKVTDEKSRKMRLKPFALPVGIFLILALGFFLIKPFLFEEVLISEPKPIAVISFENMTGDSSYDYLQKVIPNLLITSLEQSPYLRVTTWERMRDLIKQIGREDVEMIEKDLGFELCRLDGINTIVVGSFTKAGEVFVTDAKVLDVTSKKILKSASVKGHGVASILESQIDELSKEIARGIGLIESKIEETQRPIAELTTSSIQAYNYFVRGAEEIEKMYWDDGRRFLEKAIELDSTFAMAHYWLGIAYTSLGETAAMNDAFQVAKRFSKNATEKERLYIEQGFASSIERDTEKRFRINKQMAKKYPKEKLVHMRLGYYYSSKQRYDEAIQEFNKALELDPNLGIAYNSLGYAYSNTENYDKAIKNLEKYASVSPGDANPFDTMGDVFFKMGKLDESIAKFKEALAVRPDFYLSSHKIGTIFALKEDYKKTMKWMDLFITIAPTTATRAQGHLWKGFYHAWLGSFDKSLMELGQAETVFKTVENDRLITFTNLLKGWLYQETREPELGQRYYKSALSFIEKYPQQRLFTTSTAGFYTFNPDFYLGLMNLNQGRIDSAKFRLAEMKSLLYGSNPSDPQSLLTFKYDLFNAEVLLAEGFPKKVIELGEKISATPLIDIDRTAYYSLPFKIRDVLARAYRKAGELDKSIIEYERLITFDPNSKNRLLIYPKYHYRLAKLYEEKGVAVKAIEQYEKFLEIWKNADEYLPDLIDAKARLAKLKGTTAQ